MQEMATPRALLLLLCALLASSAAQAAHVEADAALTFKSPSGRKLLLDGAHLHAVLRAPSAHVRGAWLLGSQFRLLDAWVGNACGKSSSATIGI